MSSSPHERPSPTTEHYASRLCAMTSESADSYLNLVQLVGHVIVGHADREPLWPGHRQHTLLYMANGYVDQRDGIGLSLTVSVSIGVLHIELQSERLRTCSSRSHSAGANSARRANAAIVDQAAPLSSCVSQARVCFPAAADAETTPRAADAVLAAWHCGDKPGAD